MDTCEVSVVIGFRNWGQERLRLALGSLQEAFGRCQGEVILVDYGSTDPEPARTAADSSGSRLVRVDNAPVWSRSRALNAGFAQARGRLLISTDADMLFAPGALEAIQAFWQASGSSALYLQCRDLPPSLTVEKLSSGEIDWDDLETASRLRPRWGVGGMMAIDRRSYGVLRGFDERMHTYGREDMDFAARARRAGLRMAWVEDPKARIYHMWHPSSADAIRDSPEAMAALKLNRSIFDNDGTVARNRTVWNYALPDAPPLISICLPNGTDSIGDNGLANTIALQSVRDIEVLLPATAGLAQETSMESLVRKVDCQVGDLNSMLDVASGRFTIVLESSYLLPEFFLEEMLAAVQGTVRAVIPRKVAFDLESDGLEMIPIEDLYRANTIAAVLTQTDILRSIVREQNISLYTPGILEIFKYIDVDFAHSENAICLVTEKKSNLPSRDGYELPSGIRRIIENLLPENANRRIARINDGPIESLANEDFDGSLDLSVIKRDGEISYRRGLLGSASLPDLVRLRNLGCHFTVALEPSDSSEISGPGIRWIIAEASLAIAKLGATPHAVIVVEDQHEGQERAIPDPRPFSVEVERLALDCHERATIFLSKDAIETNTFLEDRKGKVRFILSQSDSETRS